MEFCGSSTCCTLTLSLRGGEALSVPRYALCAASPVLRQVLSLPLSTPGVLQLADDDPDAWHAVMRVLIPSSFVTDLANWSNVEPLLVLADKYDMAVVRGHCCQFLADHVSDMDLKQPLDSPRNVLRAASLVCLYGGGGGSSSSSSSTPSEEVAPYRKRVLAAVEGVLSEVAVLSNFSCGCHGAHFGPPLMPDKPMLSRLGGMLRDPRYPTLVVSEVQLAVTRALVKVLQQ